MSKCNTRLYNGCCPSVTPVTEDKKPEAKPLPTPVPPKPCCHTFKVENITVVGEEVFVILDDCTFLKAPKSVLDKSVSECKDAEAKASLEALQKALDELKPKVEALEAKEDKDTVYDSSVLEARVTALENASGTGSTDLTTLEARVSALETKEDKDTVYDDSALAARVKALEDTPAGDKVDTTAFVRKDELVEVANFAGTVRFKAYPADVATTEREPTRVKPDDRL